MADKPRLKSRYEEEIRPELMGQFGYTNVNEVPLPYKVSISMGVSEAGSNFDTLERAIKNSTIW